MSEKSKKLILIDGNAIIHRSYHALPPLTTKRGELVNAVYGFASTLLSVIDKFKPDYVVATFDLPGKTFRHEKFAEYKATRAKAPEDLINQIGRVKEVVRAFEIPVLEKEGFEADDVIGTIVEQVKNIKNLEVIIATGDLDTLQLVGPNTKIYNLRRGITDTTIYDEEKIRERYGIAPTQIIDFKGLRGDPSDNIPGVKGIGEKTATKLLQKFGSVEGIYKNIEKTKGVVRERLERDKAQALLSKNIATIAINVPVKVSLSDAVLRNFDRKKVINLFNELDFYSLVKRLPESKSIYSVKSSQGEVGEAEPSGVKDFEFELITENKLDEFINLLKDQGEIAIYLRTTGDKYYNSDLLGIAFSYKTGRAGYIEFNSHNKTRLKEILEDAGTKKIGYDLKYCMEILKKYNIELSGDSYDVMIAAYALNPGEKIEFKNLVLEELGEEIIVSNKKGQLGLEIESPEDRARKICRAADYIFKLKQIYEKKIKETSSTQSKNNNIKSIFEKIEMPLVKVLAQMEINGIKLDAIIFKGISKKISNTIKNLEKNIWKIAGNEFNVNSPQQLAEILFLKLKLPTEGIKKIKTGYSTASGELSKLRDKHKIVEKIEEYRELFKLKTTYLDTLPDLVDKEKRIHSTFNQAVTATGRLSSSDPNLQNIPIRTELGQLLRTAFIAEKGHKLISADYSQIDLRVVAHAGADTKLIETFYQGSDIHRATAAEIFKISPSQVTEKMRRSAKALNFGIIYGMSVFGFSEAAGIDQNEAKKFIDEYMNKFPGVADYIRKTKEFAKKNGYVETELGRRRYIPEINSPNFQVEQAAERMAVNMPIQGLAADIMKLAMLKIYANLIAPAGNESLPAGGHGVLGEDDDIRMVLQIHDEIILEVKEKMAEEIAQKIKEIMESVYKLKVPLVVNVKTGDNWGEI